MESQLVYFIWAFHLQLCIYARFDHIATSGLGIFAPHREPRGELIAL